MRTVVALALLASVSAAHAGERTQLETKVGDCLRIPVEFEGPFKVVFEITLGSDSGAQKVDVIEYEPKSDASAKGAAKLAMQLKKRCWPLGVKAKGSIRLTFSMDARFKPL